METFLMNNSNNKVVELTTSEMQQIDGGKEIWDHIAYGIGFFIGAYVDSVEYLIDEIKRL